MKIRAYEDIPVGWRFRSIWTYLCEGNRGTSKLYLFFVPCWKLLKRLPPSQPQESIVWHFVFSWLLMCCLWEVQCGISLVFGRMSFPSSRNLGTLLTDLLGLFTDAAELEMCEEIAGCKIWNAEPSCTGIVGALVESLAVSVRRRVKVISRH